jgi:hypothetical protein
MTSLFMAFSPEIWPKNDGWRAFAAWCGAAKPDRKPLCEMRARVENRADVIDWLSDDLVAGCVQDSSNQCAIGHINIRFIYPPTPRLIPSRHAQCISKRYDALHTEQ